MEMELAGFGIDFKTLEDRPTLATGQCCDLKIETEDVRVWVCRGDNHTITMERLINNRWVTVLGGHGEVII